MLVPILYRGEKVTTARKDGVEAKARLVDTAERLFSERGVEKVSLVEVSRESGQKNRNAAQYHFGDRIGLINAVLDKHSDRIAQDRRELLDELEQAPQLAMRALVEVVILPVTNHVKTDPNGHTYLQLNRQIASSSEHRVLGMRRVREMPDLLRLQDMMEALMPRQPKDVMQAKMILLQCMLFNGLANFYDTNPNGDDKIFVDTLCGSFVAVLLQDAEAG